MSKANARERLNTREWVAVVVGILAFFAGTVSAALLHADGTPPSWAGWALALTAIIGIIVAVTTLVRGLLRGDTEGVERQDAARASMITVLVIVVGGFGYSLLEAFAGLPRVTTALLAAVAATIWVTVFSWPQSNVEKK